MGWPTSIMLGVCAGLLLTAAANLFFLPRVAEQQKRKFGSSWKMPLTGWSQETLLMYTKFGYRFVMPLVFSAVFSTAIHRITNEASGVN